MHFFQLAATWLFPCAVCATLATTAATATTTDGASAVEHDSSSSPPLSAGGVKAGTDRGPSPSASSATTSPSTSSLSGTRSGSPNSARSPEKQDGGGAAATPKGDAVRRCLRRLARKLQRGEGADDVRPDGRRGRKKSRSTKPDKRAAGFVDGNPREREEAVASAVSHGKETTSRRRSGTSPPPPSPSLDGWLLDLPEEASHGKCPALRRDVSLLEWLPEAQACADVPRRASCDGYSGKSVAETGKRASRRALTGELGAGDTYGGLDIDVLRIMNYFDAKYELQCNVESWLT